MLNMAVRNTRKLIRAKSKEENIRIGRSFSKKPTAALMASMLSFPAGKPVSILDPGAGTGILSAAAVEAACKAGVSEIQLTCYETDGEFLPMLRNNLERLRKKCRHDYGIKLISELCEENYVVAQRDVFTPSLLALDAPTYDVVIAYPPSRLCERKSPECTSCGSLCTDQTDIAFLFAVMGMLNLKEGGQMVINIPTAYASAFYLDRVRGYLMQHGCLRRIHMFLKKSRHAGRPDTLKKSMILSFTKTQPTEGDTIALFASYDEGETAVELPAQPVSNILREDGTLLLLRSQYDFDMIRCMARMPQTLSSLGLKMRTGLTLESRYPDKLRDTPEEGSVPLIRPACIEVGQIRFPLRAPKQYLIPAIPSLAQRNKNMLLIKRVPAKSDARRLMCGIYLASQLPRCRYISTSNKLNYIDFEDKREMDSAFLHGLYAVLTSDLYSDYCAMFSRASQINASDFADLPMPDEKTIRAIGEKVMITRQLTSKICTQLVYSALRIVK